MTDANERPKILFVDDEADLLSGIRSNLRKRRKVWDLHFACGGEAAMELLKEHAFDVVVSDMRMPGMDGAELLGRAREICPGAVRIVLSGHADESATMRGAVVAQQWLAKPCDRPTLIAALEHALVARELIADTTARVAALGIKALPSPPEILDEIRRLASDPECAIEALAEAINQDPAVSAKILQLTNSAFFSLPCEISNVAEAIPRLGIDTVSGLAVSEAAIRALSMNDHIDRDVFASIQRRSLRCAQLAGAFAREIEAIDPDQSSVCFTAGLLHSVGHLVLMGTELDGVDAPRVGAGFLSAWGLPLAIVDGVARHVDLHAIEGEPRPTSICVHVASRVIAAVESDAELAPHNAKELAMLAPLLDRAVATRVVNTFFSDPKEGTPR